MKGVAKIYKYIVYNRILRQFNSQNTFLENKERWNVVEMLHLKILKNKMQTQMSVKF